MAISQNIFFNIHKSIIVINIHKSIIVRLNQYNIFL